MDNRVRFFDTTLRDGEQAPGYGMNIEEKLRIALELEVLGVDVMEAGFPIASEGDFKSVQQIARTIKTVVVCGLSRALQKDIDATAAAIRDAVRPRIHTFLATSDLHLQYKLKMTRERALEQVRTMVAYARNLCDDVEFSAEDATRSDRDYLCKVVEAAIASGATTINLPDTVGYSVPTELYQMIKDVRERVPNIDRAVLSVHCHDDLGLAVANSLAGISAGARQAECTISGIGERAGNASLEEIVMGLRTRHDFYNDLEYGIRTEEICKAARLLSSITGVKIAPNKAIVGPNAFAHESGIHQHGVLANAKTYEIMTPESVGAQKTPLVLGKHSGRHAFASRLEELGYKLPAERIDALFAEFKEVADRKKTITDRDVVALVENTATSAALDPDKQWVLDNFVVNSGNTMTSTACVTMHRGKKRVQEAAMGTGPIYAAIRAVEKIVRHPFRLEDYQLQAVTEHRDALGEAIVKVADETGVYRGRGVSTDVIEASILATIVAVNQMLDAGNHALGTGAASIAQHAFDNDMLAGHSDKTTTELPE